MLKSLFKNILTVEKNIEIIKVLLKVIIIALHHLSLATTKRDKQHVYRYKTTFITILSTRHLPPGVLKFHASLHAWSLLKALIMTQLWWKPATYASYTGCSRRNVRDFGRVFLRSNYTDITQNTYIQSSMAMEILAREVWNFDSYYSLIDYQIHIETGRNMWFL